MKQAKKCSVLFLFILNVSYYLTTVTCKCYEWIWPTQKIIPLLYEHPSLIQASSWRSWKSWSPCSPGLASWPLRTRSHWPSWPSSPLEEPVRARPPAVWRWGWAWPAWRRLSACRWAIPLPPGPRSTLGGGDVVQPCICHLTSWQCVIDSLAVGLGEHLVLLQQSN